MSPPQEILQRQDDMTLCKGLYYIDTTTASVSRVPGMRIIYLIYYYCIIVLVFIGIHAMKFYGILNGMTMRFVSLIYLVFRMEWQRSTVKYRWLPCYVTTMATSCYMTSAGCHRLLQFGT